MYRLSLAYSTSSPSLFRVLIVAAVQTAAVNFGEAAQRQVAREEATYNVAKPPRTAVSLVTQSLWIMASNRIATITPFPK